MNYNTEQIKYMPGYTGHVPKIQREEKTQSIEYKKHIPNYKGYISGIKSENIYGISYGKETSKSLSGQIEKGRDALPNKRFTSVYRESFTNHKNVKSQSTAELLGVSNRKDIYKKVKF